MTRLAEARSATMHFGDFTAVDGVDLAITEGEIVGLLGANGAGKTTLIRMLLGLLRVTSGDVLLFGSEPSRITRRRVGYVPQTLGLYDDMTVEENWDFTATAFGIGRPAMPNGIVESKSALVGDLSLGLQRRVAFAGAFSHKPELLILDEPTSGVGPLSRARLWEAIRDSADHGTGVLVTTHNMEEAEQCDRLVVMAEGQVVAAGTTVEVIGDRQVVQIACEDWSLAFKALDSEGLVVQVQGGHLRVPGNPEGVQGLLTRRDLVGEVSAVPANLEEAFVDIVTRPSSL